MKTLLLIGSIRVGFGICFLTLLVMLWIRALAEEEKCEPAKRIADTCRSELGIAKGLQIILLGPITWVIFIRSFIENIKD